MAKLRSCIVRDFNGYFNRSRTTNQKLKSKVKKSKQTDEITGKQGIATNHKERDEIAFDHESPTCSKFNKANEIEMKEFKTTKNEIFTVHNYKANGKQKKRKETTADHENPTACKVDRVNEVEMEDFQQSDNDNV